MTSYTVAIMVPAATTCDFTTPSLWEAYRKFRLYQAQGLPVLLLGSYPAEDGMVSDPQIKELTQVLLRGNI